MKKFQIIFIFAFLLISNVCASNDTFMNGLMKRINLGHQQDFFFETLPSDNGNDVFEIESRDGKIVIRGNNGVARASGLDYYLENYCGCQISIHYNQLSLPAVLPQVKQKIRVVTPFNYRYFFNYCTFGYTMPWWGWDEWEKIIDYMALKGVNMPLAIIGQEAVWQKVYNKLGISNKQLENFFVGPAHLPWGWMGNIDGLAGPLPQSWFTKREALQKQILERQRAYGMTPVLQAFTGHVPKELIDHFPKSKIVKINDWAGVTGTYFLDPSDPLFSKIGSMFIKEQNDMFGTDHLYDADCFIEVDPPSNKPEFLKTTSKAIYESMASVDPQAKWVIQGWFLFFRSSFWKKEQSMAFFEGIPKNKAIILDLYGEKNPTWDKTDAFYGQPWIWNVICNEDQKVNMSGDLQAMDNEFQRAFAKEGNHNLKGIGVIPEGFGYNMIVQDFIFSKTWNQKKINIDEWVKNYAHKRYGTNSKEALEAWSYLLKSVYSRTRTMWSPLITTPQLVKFSGEKEDIRHNRVEFRITKDNPFAWDFNVYDLEKAAKLLLSCNKELKNNEAYKFDLTNVYRELLHTLTHRYIDAVSVAYDKKDLKALDKAEHNMLKLFDDLDEVTGCNDNFMIGKWLSQSKKWGDTKQEKAYYENNARTILTIWQPWEKATLRDYAGREWNGLLKDYYKPRWEVFIDMLKDAIKNNKEFVRADYTKKVQKMDYQWTLKQNSYPDKGKEDIIKVAQRILKEYSSEFER